MTYTPEQLREDGHFGTREEMIARYKELKAAHADALEELARLRSRLEIDFVTDGNGKRVPFPEGGPDGVACRDETIRLLEAALAEAERKCERVKHHAEAMAHYTDCYKDKWPDSGARQALEEYRAEFKEES